MYDGFKCRKLSFNLTKYVTLEVFILQRTTSSDITAFVVSDDIKKETLISQFNVANNINYGFLRCLLYRAIYIR